jgi:drug/metabolite transporter (DMT)-like permease
MNRSNLPSVFTALAAAALFGASAPFSKLLLGHIEPIPLAALLYLGSGLSALLFRSLMNLRVKKDQPQETSLSRGDIPWLVGAIFSGGVAAPILLLVGLQHTPAAAASLLLNFETVATTLIAFIVFHEAVGKRAGWAVALVTLASILLSATSAGGWGVSLGALAILSACFLWGVDNNFTRNISAKDPLTIVLFKGLGAGVFSALLAVGLKQPFPAWSGIFLALLLGALSYGLSITLFILAMRAQGAARTSALFGTAPFVGACIAMLLLAEQPTRLFLPALALMAAGAWLLLSEDHAHLHRHEAFEHDHRHTHNDSHHLHTHAENELAEGDSHAHPHTHPVTQHSHPHLPDIHHRHAH